MTKFVLFIDKDYVLITTPKDEKMFLKRYILNRSKTAPKGMKRVLIESRMLKIGGLYTIYPLEGEEIRTKRV